MARFTIGVATRTCGTLNDECRTKSDERTLHKSFSGLNRNKILQQKRHQQQQGSVFSRSKKMASAVRRVRTSSTASSSWSSSSSSSATTSNSRWRKNKIKNSKFCESYRKMKIKLRRKKFFPLILLRFIFTTKKNQNCLGQHLGRQFFYNSGHFLSNVSVCRPEVGRQHLDDQCQVLVVY